MQRHRGDALRSKGSPHHGAGLAPQHSVEKPVSTVLTLAGEQAGAAEAVMGKLEKTLL